MQLNGIDLWLWLAVLIAHILLVGVLFARERVRHFPIFTGLIVLNVGKTLVLFIVYRHLSALAYYDTYLAFAGVDYSLQIAVVFEIGRHVFRTSAGNEDIRRSLILAGVAALVISSVLSWIALPATKWLSDTLVIRADLLTAVLMTEFFVAMLVLSVRYGLPWKTHAAKIAQGLAFYSSICIVVEALHTYFGLKDGSATYTVVTRIRIVAYELIVCYWIATLSQDAPAEREMPYELQVQLIALQRRASTIVRLLQNWTRA